MKHIVHIDLNAYFIQVESLLNPSLNDVPAAVGYDFKRGVLSTSNYLARKYGVNSGDPIALSKKKCPDLVIVEPHYRLYQEYSNKFFKLLKEKTNLIEIASIDEAYLDLTKYLENSNVYDKLFDLQTEIYRKTNLKCSIGCSYTKFFAKMASDLVKPLGLTIITKENYKDILFNLSINKIYGLGKKTCIFLNEKNINTINDLVNTKNNDVLSFLGNRYSQIINELNGNSSDYINTNKFIPKSISSEHTFQNDEEDFENIKLTLVNSLKTLIKQLKKDNKLTGGITIKIRTSDFKTITKKLTLKEHSDQFEYLYLNLMNLYEDLNFDKPIRLIGVKCDNLISENDILNNEKDTGKLF